MKCPICKEEMDWRYKSVVVWGQVDVDGGEEWFRMLRNNIKENFWECFECRIIKEVEK